jgi:hypothetical protein
MFRLNLLILLGVKLVLVCEVSLKKEGNPDLEMRRNCLASLTCAFIAPSF